MVKKSHTQPGIADTAIARDIHIKGDLTSANDIWIDGTLEGSISTEGNVIIAENGRINGDISARSIEARGGIDGNLSAQDAISCQPGARISGDLHAPDIAIASGAVVIGRLSRPDEPPDQEPELDEEA